MAERCVALHRDCRNAPCSSFHFLLPDRNLGRPQGYPWVNIGEALLSRCANAVDRLTVRADLYVDDSDIMLAGSHVARFASWCEPPMRAGSQFWKA